MRRLLLALVLSGTFLGSLAAAPDAQVYFQKGSEALTRRQSAQAITYFEKALDLNSDLALAWRGLGVAMSQQNRWKESVLAHRRSTRLRPQDAKGWLNLGWAEHRSGNDKVAVKVLNHAWELDHNDPQIANALGVVYLFLNQPQQAEAATRQVLALDSKNATAYYNLGLALHRQGHWDESIQALEQARVYEPHNPHPQVALALVYAARGDQTSARAAYQRAVQMDQRYRQSAYLDTLLEADFSREQVAGVRRLQQAAGKQ
ncbi:tetratricopeptide repeat protein [Anthocerotibacter panamensis]|uniref:tetratricopeptide repeat protein n=1 Tax=Anthocerotibacter panamensis TaxID=2857077 RepID=UPI001C4079AE|nr:tetratricopeptide repeat protein [Anthocerotibacter panamensis]